MPGYDQHHALEVMRTLQEMGHGDPDLLVAALLHDVGKTVDQRGALRLWHRVSVVLMRAFWPSLLERLGQSHPGNWRRPFFVQQHHAESGAELAHQAGCTARTVELIRRHEDPSSRVDDPFLAALQAADGAN
jgi:putative nucleotidyltransferase with HDIG domain